MGQTKVLAPIYRINDRGNGLTQAYPLLVVNGRAIRPTRDSLSMVEEYGMVDVSYTVNGIDRSFSLPREQIGTCHRPSGRPVYHLKGAL